MPELSYWEKFHGFLGSISKNKASKDTSPIADSFKKLFQPIQESFKPKTTTVPYAPDAPAKVGSFQAITESGKKLSSQLEQKIQPLAKLPETMEREFVLPAMKGFVRNKTVYDVLYGKEQAKVGEPRGKVLPVIGGFAGSVAAISTLSKVLDIPLLAVNYLKSNPIVKHAISFGLSRATIDQIAQPLETAVKDRADLFKNQLPSYITFSLAAGTAPGKIATWSSLVFGGQYLSSKLSGKDNAESFKDAFNVTAMMTVFKSIEYMDLKTLQKQSQSNLKEVKTDITKTLKVPANSSFEVAQKAYHNYLLQAKTGDPAAQEKVIRSLQSYITYHRSLDVFFKAKGYNPKMVSDIWTEISGVYDYLRSAAGSTSAMQLIQSVPNLKGFVSFTGTPPPPPGGLSNLIGKKNLKGNEVTEVSTTDGENYVIKTSLPDDKGMTSHLYTPEQATEFAKTFTIEKSVKEEVPAISKVDYPQDPVFKSLVQQQAQLEAALDDIKLDSSGIPVNQREADILLKQLKDNGLKIIEKRKELSAQTTKEEPIPVVTEPIEEPLAKEAIKYKSAEEFVRKVGGIDISTLQQKIELIRLFPKQEAIGTGIVTEEVLYKIKRAVDKTGYRKFVGTGVSESGMKFNNRLVEQGYLKNPRVSKSKSGTDIFIAEITDKLLEEAPQISPFVEIWNEANQAKGITPDVVKPIEESLTRLSKKIYDLTMETGGATLGIKGNTPKERYIFASSKETEKIVPKDSLSDKDVLDYVNQHLAELEAGKYAGTWVDEGNVYLDVPEGNDDLDYSLTTANNAKQISIYDQQTKKSINVEEALRERALHVQAPKGGDIRADDSEDVRISPKGGLGDKESPTPTDTGEQVTPPEEKSTPENTYKKLQDALKGMDERYVLQAQMRGEALSQRIGETLPRLEGLTGEERVAAMKAGLSGELPKIYEPIDVTPEELGAIIDDVRVYTNDRPDLFLPIEREITIPEALKKIVDGKTIAPFELDLLRQIPQLNEIVKEIQRVYKIAGKSTAKEGPITIFLNVSKTAKFAANLSFMAYQSALVFGGHPIEVLKIYAHVLRYPTIQGQVEISKAISTDPIGQLMGIRGMDTISDILPAVERWRSFLYKTKILKPLGYVSKLGATIWSNGVNSVKVFAVTQKLKYDGILQEILDAEKSGIPIKEYFAGNPEAFKSLQVAIEMANTLTLTRKAPKALRAISFIFSSTSIPVSQADLLSFGLSHKNWSAKDKAYFIKEILRGFATGLLMLMALDKYHKDNGTGFAVWDPHDTNFLRLVIKTKGKKGQTLLVPHSIPFFVKLPGLVSMFTKMVTGEKRSYTSPTKYTATKLGEGYKPITAATLVGQYVLNHLSPGVTAVKNVLAGKDWYGNSTNLFVETARLGIPLPIESIVREASLKDIDAMTIGDAFFQFMGGSLYVRELKGTSASSKKGGGLTLPKLDLDLPGLSLPKSSGFSLPKL